MFCLTVITAVQLQYILTFGIIIKMIFSNPSQIIITVKSRFYVIVGQHHMERKIEILHKIETRYVVNSKFGHQTFQRKFKI